jgi:7-cyano-7-deazaguanine synthase
MCSIQGYLRLREDTADEVAAQLTRIIHRAEDRGRDSCGAAGVTADCAVRSRKGTDTPSEVADAEMAEMLSDSVLAIANTRAESTTEYVEDADADTDVQPFGGPDGRFWVVHNGVIANDDALATDCPTTPDTDIDTAVLPHVLAADWDSTFDTLPDILARVTGSFALAIVDRLQPDTLYLATSYKPLVCQYSDDLGALLFASRPEYLPAEASLFDTGRKRRTLQPYTVAQVTAGGITERPLGPRSATRTDDSRPRTLVVASGGLDSSTVATTLVRDGRDVGLVHFQYRCRAEVREREAVETVADTLDVPLEVVDLGGLFDEVIGGSPLLADDGELADTDTGARLAHEWVPARNLVMLSVATAYAEAHGYDTVASGINLEEAGAYPDNEMAFIDRFAAVLPYATGPDARVTVEMPVGNLTKHEIVRLALDVDAPLADCWSCYEGGERHCGTCGPCYMRQTAFAINDATDPLAYESALDEDGRRLAE